MFYKKDRDDVSILETHHSHHRVYPSRWLQLLVYVLATFANAMASGTFAPIISHVTIFYNVSVTAINSLAIVFLFLYPVGTSLSIWLSRKLRLRMIMIIGSLANLGILFRFLSLINPLQGYAALMIGQILCAVGKPFFLNAAALFAARWFDPSQRDIATSISSMANPLGLAIGTLAPSLIISGNETTTNDFYILYGSEGGFTLLTTILVIFIFRSDPPTPPSTSEEHHQSIDLKRDFIKLMTNVHYLTLLFGFSLGLAVFNALTTLLAQLIEPTGYRSDAAGAFGAGIIVAGLINAFLVGIIMDKTHAYRIILRVLLIGACLSGLFFVLVLRPDEYYLLAIAIGLMGFFLLPLLPVTFECAVECTYPIRPEWSTGLLLCIGNILSGIFIFVLEYLISLASIYQSGHVFTPAAIFILSIFVLSGLILFTYRGPYLRLLADRDS